MTGNLKLTEPDGECAALPTKALFTDFTVIIPTLNEEATIGKLIEQLLRLYPGINIIIADDNSSDTTEVKVSSIAKLHPKGQVRFLGRDVPAKKGLTASVIDGIGYCTSKYFLVMDADFQHPPKLIGQMIQKLLNPGISNNSLQEEVKLLVIACRKKMPGFDSYYRYMLSFLACRLTSYFLYTKKIQVRDPMSGCFGSRRDWVWTLISNNNKNWEVSGYKILFDILKSLPASTRIIEVPYHFAARADGYSKFRFIHSFYVLRSLFR